MIYRTALITGASSGIGRGLALALARRGTHVIAAARRRPELESLAAEVAAEGGSCEPLLLDVADADATHATVRALDGKRPLDLVVANAGVSGRMPAAKLDWTRVRDVLQVNLLGATATLCGALAGMIERRSGHLVGIASLAGFRGLPGYAAYSSSKAGLATFCESLRLDLHGSGVHVTTICPGFIKTPLTANHQGTMPFLMELDAAVATIVKAIDRQEAEYAFPWQLAIALKSSKLVPESLFVAMNRRAKIDG